MWEQFFDEKVFKRSVISFLSIEFKMDSHKSLIQSQLKACCCVAKTSFF
jgi:hypothetical protein